MKFGESIIYINKYRFMSEIFLIYIIDCNSTKNKRTVLKF